MTEAPDRGDTVELWLVPGHGPEAALPDLYSVLDADERGRADSYRSADHRRLFVLAHGAVRHIVARRLGAPPEEIRWARGPHGKPELAGRWTGAQVNLSHSGDVAMVAVTTSRPVGVDVQQILPRVDAAAMARRYFPPEETGLVCAEPDAEGRADRFARLWARKEALVKAHGGRLTQGLRIPVHALGTPHDDQRALDGAAADSAVADGQAVVVQAASSQAEDEQAASGHPDDAWARGYRIADVPAPDGYRAAVALAGSAGYRLVRHQWTWQPVQPAGQPSLNPTS